MPPGDLNTSDGARHNSNQEISMGVRLVSVLALTVLATACDDDGLLPLSEYDSIALAYADARNQT